MAGDPFLTWILMGLGLRDLSMDPDRIPLVKAVVRGSTLAEATQLATEALALDDEVQNPRPWSARDSVVDSPTRSMAPLYLTPEPRP